MSPLLLGYTENFIPANPLLTPVHIQPEWYFLFAYAILRSIPNKLGWGVLCLVLSIAMLFILPLIDTSNMYSNKNFLLPQYLFWIFSTLLFLLAWIGACPVETPYIILGQYTSFLYFMSFLLIPTFKLQTSTLLN